MVDQKKRNTIKKIGIGGLLLMGGYGGYEAYAHHDDRMDPDTLEASIEEAAAKGGNIWGERDWGNTHLSVDDITAAVTETGERESGATLYEAALNAPLDAPFAVADFDGDIPMRDALADRLQVDALLCFDALYDAAGPRNVHARKPYEDAVDSYRLRFDDGTGYAEVAIPAGEAFALAQGTAFDTDEDDGGDLETQSFMQTYMTRFEVYADGGK